MCSLSRYLLVGGLSGMAVATLSGSELVGWLAAAVVIGLAVAAGRLFPARFGRSTCPLPARDEPASTTEAHEVATPR